MSSDQHKVSKEVIENANDANDNRNESAISRLQKTGANLSATLGESLDEIVPKMPKRLSPIEKAQYLIADSLDILPEFLEDEDYEMCMRNALEAMGKLRNEPLKSVDPSTLHASEIDILESKSNPEALV